MPYPIYCVLYFIYFLTEGIKLDKCEKNTGITKNALRLRYRIMDDQITSKTQVKCRNKYRLFIEINNGVLYGLRK